MHALLDVILPVFLVIAAGYTVVWLGWFSDNAVNGLVTFAQSFAIPALLFRAIASLDLEASFDWPLLFAFYTGALLSFFTGLFGARLLFRRDWPDSVAIGFACLYSNSILLGLAITERAYGSGALSGNYAIVALHVPFCYLVGVTSMEISLNGGNGAGAAVRQVAGALLRNPIIIAIALGICVNATGLGLPVAIRGGLDLIVPAAIPAALFGLGGVLYRYRPDGDTRIILGVGMVSLVLHPSITFAIGHHLALDRDALRSAVVTASMAPGVNAYLFANMYGRARRIVASSVLFATLGSVITVWTWLNLLP